MEAFAGSDFGWQHLHQGGRRDPITGLYHFRYRDYSAALGRWLNPDPAGYIDGANLYQALRSSPVELTDPSGLDPANSDKVLLDRVLQDLNARGKIGIGSLDSRNPHAEELGDAATIVDTIRAKSLSDALGDLGKDIMTAVLRGLNALRGERIRNALRPILDAVKDAASDKFEEELKKAGGRALAATGKATVRGEKGEGAVTVVITKEGTVVVVVSGTITTSSGVREVGLTVEGELLPDGTVDLDPGSVQPIR